MTLWARLDAIAGAAVDVVTGEPILITPQVVSQYKGATPDGSRAAVTVRGKFSLAPEVDGIDGANSNRRKRSMGSSSTAGVALAIVVIEAAQAALIPYALRQKDYLSLSARTPIASYAIDLIDYTDTGAMILHLVARSDGSGAALDLNSAGSSGLSYLTGTE